MNRNVALILLGCCLAMTACKDKETNTQTGATVTLRMEQQADGRLQYCDAQGACHDLPNPNDCAILQVTINNVSGATCETCTAADGSTISESCGQTSVQCVVVTVPEPDCVVCAYIDGAVIYSSCIPEQPDDCYTYATGTAPAGAEAGRSSGGSAGGANDSSMPSSGSGGGSAGMPAMTCATDTDCPPDQPCMNGVCTASGDCTICYGADGRPVMSDCGRDCSAVMCPAVRCPEGYVPTIAPGDCCEQCVPVYDCANVSCSESPMLDCPPGTALVRDPANCCGYRCEPTSCDQMACPAVAFACPQGFVADYTFPNCCGACVPTDQGRMCLSDADCAAGTEFCTAGISDCMPGGGCDPSSGMMCPSVCSGYCRPIDYVCPAFPPPDPAACAGRWEFGGRDQYGCPLPPVCVCPDGVISLDGTCADACAQTMCFAPPPTCEAGTHLEMGYPFCCGICVPDDQCMTARVSCRSDADCAAGDLCMSGYCTPSSSTNSGTTAVACAEPMCSSASGTATTGCCAGQHLEPGPGCCPICVNDAKPCAATSECAVGETCSTEFGDCMLPPGCDPNSGMMCAAVCYGICVLTSATSAP